MGKQVQPIEQELLSQELAVLRALLVEMFDLVEEQLADAVNAVSSSDDELGQRVRSRDQEVDALDLKIDRQCEHILSRFHPSGVALRTVIAAARININLERIGDHAKNLTKHVRHLRAFSDVLHETHLIEMADAARNVLRETQDALYQQDRLKAWKVLAHDLRIDRLYEDTLQRIVQLSGRRPEHAEALVHLVLMSKGIERVADHAKNISECIVFLVEGAHIRHREQRKTDAGA